MQKSELSNINISDEQVLITPDELKVKLPLSEKARRFIQESRQTIANIIHKKDHRLLVVCGPCSIHDIEAAKDYAKRLKALSEQLSDQLYIVMRVYFEKPRTTVGWKGLINDPHLDGSFDIEHGLHVGRELLVELAEMEIPLATEALDPISPQYLADTFSWQRSAHAQQNHKHTVRWLVVFRCRLALRMAQMAVWQPQSMRCRPPLLATALWVSTVKVKLRCLQPKVTRMAT